MGGLTFALGRECCCEVITVLGVDDPNNFCVVSEYLNCFPIKKRDKTLHTWQNSKRPELKEHKLKQRNYF